MPTSQDIISAIAEHLGLNPEDLDRNASLQDELGLGPIELNDLLSILSQKYKVHFEADDIEHLSKIEDIIVLVEDNLL